MKTTYMVLLSSLFVLAASQAQAGSISGLTTFSPNTTAKSSEVNGNFSTVQTAVNDNNSRLTTVEGTVSSNSSSITTLQGTVSTNSTAITTLQGAVSANSSNISILQSNPSIAGNLTLPESSDANTGNIMKGTFPFLHDYGTGNTFLGEDAGNFSMTGNYNTANGYGGLYSNTSGSQNTATGYQALNLNATGSQNTANGYQALTSNVGGNGNMANGVHALYNNTSGSYNTATGYQALYNNTIGGYNSAIGGQTLYNITSGQNNIAVGYAAGLSLTTENYNIDIGSAGFPGDNNTIRIGVGYNSSVSPATGQNAVYIEGIRAITTGNADAIGVVIDSNGQLGTYNSSRRVKDHIRSMDDASDVLNKLRPVTFYYKTDHDPKGRHLQYGLVAEEVAKVAPGLVAYSKDGKIETVYYRFLAPMLLNQYQKQQKVIAEQGALLKEQATEITALKKQSAHMARLETKVKEIDVLKRQLARLTTVLALRNQRQQLASAATEAR